MKFWNSTYTRLKSSPWYVFSRTSLGRVSKGDIYFFVFLEYLRWALVGFGMTLPDVFDTLTLIPDWVNVYPTFVPLLVSGSMRFTFDTWTGNSLLIVFVLLIPSSSWTCLYLFEVSGCLQSWLLTQEPYFYSSTLSELFLAFFDIFLYSLLP